MKAKAHKRPASEWLRISAAAKVLGVHRATVLNRAVKGEFRMTQVGDVVFVHRADVEAASQAAPSAA